MMGKAREEEEDAMSSPDIEPRTHRLNKTQPHYIEMQHIKGALYRVWCGVNRLGDCGVNVV